MTTINKNDREGNDNLDKNIDNDFLNDYGSDDEVYNDDGWLDDDSFIWYPR